MTRVGMWVLLVLWAVATVGRAEEPEQPRSERQETIAQLRAAIKVLRDGSREIRRLEREVAELKTKIAVLQDIQAGRVIDGNKLLSPGHRMELRYFGGRMQYVLVPIPSAQQAAASAKFGDKEFQRWLALKFQCQVKDLILFDGHRLENRQRVLGEISQLYAQFSEERAANLPDAEELPSPKSILESGAKADEDELDDYEKAAESGEIYPVIRNQ